MEASYPRCPPSSMINWIFQSDHWELLLCSPQRGDRLPDDAQFDDPPEISGAGREISINSDHALWMSQPCGASSTGDTGSYATRLSTDDEIIARVSTNDEAITRATSFSQWALVVYVPWACLAYFYVLFLGWVGAVRPSDWTNGSAWLAVATTPLVFTIVLAVVVCSPS